MNITSACGWLTCVWKPRSACQPISWIRMLWPPEVHLLYCSAGATAYSTSAPHSVMMGGTTCAQHQNWVTDYYITVVPVQTGLLLLEEIRVYRTGFPRNFWGDFFFPPNLFIYLFAICFFSFFPERNFKMQINFKHISSCVFRF